MRNKLSVAFLALFCLSLSFQASAFYPRQAPLPFETRDSVTRRGYTLVFINHEQGFDTITKQKMIEAFFDVYPREVKRFNRHALKRVVFLIDPGYDGVAETADGQARYSPRWLKKHPEDIDVVTHEVMHIVQDYKGESPGWLTEGIADYARYVYGVNNRRGNWKLPDYEPRQNYRDAYRVTARFLLWIEKNKNKHIVDRMDFAVRAGTYTPGLWVKLTGSTVDALWKEYSNNPGLELSYR